MLDTTMTVIDITHKHSSTCELNKYVERHGGIDNLQVEDIRTLVQADQAVFPEMIPMTISTKIPDTGERAASSAVHTEPQPSKEDILSVVTNPSLTATTPIHDISADSTCTKTPLPVVTPLDPSLGKETMPAVMTATPLHVVTEPTTNSSIGIVAPSTPLTVSRTSASETSKQLMWSRILNRPVELVPTAEAGGEDNELPQPISSGNPGQSITADNPGTNLTDKYYEVLTPSQDDVVCISHMDILNSRCTVQLERLNKNTIRSLETGVSTLPSQSSSTESSDTKVPKKKSCYQPKMKLSRDRVRAQQIITARKKCKKPLTFQSHSLPPAEPNQPDTGVPAQDSSNNTIIYTPPPSPKKKSKKKQVTKFIIRTMGLKTHLDTDAVIACNKKRNHNFKCYLCGESFASTKSLNTHVRINHKGLDCIVCDKEFNSPMSLKKHSYIHKLCTFNCSRCDKVFPFKSQRDFYEKVHDNLRFSCTRKSCDSSFSHEGDLRQHMERHDMEPIKCKHCEYKNTDIRNVRQHMRHHTGEKPYKCSKIGTDFKYAMQKKRHTCKDNV